MGISEIKRDFRGIVGGEEERSGRVIISGIVRFFNFRGTHRSLRDGTTVHGSGKLMQVLERQPDVIWRIAWAIWNEYRLIGTMRTRGQRNRFTGQRFTLDPIVNLGSDQS